MLDDRHVDIITAKLNDALGKLAEIKKICDDNAVQSDNDIVARIQSEIDSSMILGKITQNIIGILMVSCVRPPILRNKRQHVIVEWVLELSDKLRQIEDMVVNAGCPEGDVVKSVETIILQRDDRMTQDDVRFIFKCGYGFAEMDMSTPVIDRLMEESLALLVRRQDYDRAHMGYADLEDFLDDNA